MNNIIDLHFNGNNGFIIELDGIITSGELDIIRVTSKKYHILNSKNNIGRIHIIHKLNRFINIIFIDECELYMKFDNLELRNGFRFLGNNKSNVKINGNSVTINPIYVKGIENITIPYKKSFKPYNKKNFGISRRKYNKKIKRKIQLKKIQRNKFRKEYNPNSTFISVENDSCYTININSLNMMN